MQPTLIDMTLLSCHADEELLHDDQWFPYKLLNQMAHMVTNGLKGFNGILDGLFLIS